MKNVFTQALVAGMATSLRPGLESADTVEVGDLHPQEKILPTKTGLAEEKAGEEHPESDKVIGDEADFGSEDIDWIAQSQMQTVALESIATEMRRIGRMCTALENIADGVQTQLDADKPLDAVQTALITTALDASEVGAEPLAESIALEAYSADLRVATEGFVDRLHSRAQNVKEAWVRGWSASMATSRAALTSVFQSNDRLAGQLKEALVEYRALGKVGGKEMPEAKYTEAVFAAPSDRSVYQAAIGSIKAFTKAYDLLVKDVLHGADLKINGDEKRGVAEKEARKVVAALNERLETLKKFAESNAHYCAASLTIQSTDKSIDFDGDVKSGDFKLRAETRKPNGVGGVLKTATVAEAEAIVDEARAVTREFERMIQIMAEFSDRRTLEAMGKTAFGVLLSPLIVLAELSANSNAAQRITAINGFLDSTQYRNAELIISNQASLVKDTATQMLFNHAVAMQRNMGAALKWVRDSIKQEKKGGAAE